MKKWTFEWTYLRGFVSIRCPNCTRKSSPWICCRYACQSQLTGVGPLASLSSITPGVPSGATTVTILSFFSSSVMCLSKGMCQLDILPCFPRHIKCSYLAPAIVWQNSPSIVLRLQPTLIRQCPNLQEMDRFTDNHHQPSLLQTPTEFPQAHDRLLTWDDHYTLNA